MAATRVTTASRAARIMALRVTMALRITMLKPMAVRRATILRGLPVRTRRLRCALPAPCGSRVITASTDTARCLPIAALTGSGRAIMADASSPGTGVARAASSVVMDPAVARASPATMTLVAAWSAGELSPEAISGAERLADRALQETIASAAERKARDPSTVGRASAAERRTCDLPEGSLTAAADGAQVADNPVADTDRERDAGQRLDEAVEGEAQASLSTFLLCGLATENDYR